MFWSNYVFDTQPGSFPNGERPLVYVAPLICSVLSDPDVLLLLQF
jgi:hypothetical protein